MNLYSCLGVRTYRRPCNIWHFIRHSNGFEILAQRYSPSLNEMIRAFSSGEDTKDGGGYKSSNEDLVKRIRQKFHGEDSSSELKHQRLAWESLWKEKTTPWDLGKPSPALISELKSHWNTTTNWKQTTTSSVFRTLIPGCGAGHDIMTLAWHLEEWITRSKGGFAASPPNEAIVVGLDVSETSLMQNASPVVKKAYSEGCTLQHTRVELVHGDFFTGSLAVPREDGPSLPWKILRSFGSDGVNSMETPHTSVSSCDDATDSSTLESSAHFDFIFDCTFFCALPPSLRPAWGARTAELLAPGTGRLLTFIFPIQQLEQQQLTGGEGAMLGPPYSVTVEDYRIVLEPHGVFMEEDDGPRKNLDTVPARTGRELVCWWRRHMK